MVPRVFRLCVDDLGKEPFSFAERLACEEQVLPRARLWVEADAAMIERGRVEVAEYEAVGVQFSCWVWCFGDGAFWVGGAPLAQDKARVLCRCAKVEAGGLAGGPDFEGEWCFAARKS